MKTLKIGLTESLGFYNKKAPQRVHSKKWCRWQACAVALHTAALRPRSPKTARFPSPNLGRLGHRTLLRKPNPPPTKHHNKKLREGGFLLWCAILCKYRTNFYDEYKQLKCIHENTTNSLFFYLPPFLCC